MSNKKQNFHCIYTSSLKLEFLQNLTKVKNFQTRILVNFCFWWIHKAKLVIGWVYSQGLFPLKVEFVGRLHHCAPPEAGQIQRPLDVSMVFLVSRFEGWVRWILLSLSQDALWANRRLFLLLFLLVMADEARESCSGFNKNLIV